MAFGMPYQNYPSGFYQPVPDQLTQLRQPYQQPMQQQSQSAPIIWVQGEEGAKAYMVAAGNSVLLMDSENSTFYIKSTDGSGMPQPLRVFDYKERSAPQKAAPQNAAADFVTRNEFNALAAKLETALAALKEKEDPDDE